MNIIKGIDRITVLLAVPLAIFYGYKCYQEHVNDYSVGVFLGREEMETLSDLHQSMPLNEQKQFADLSWVMLLRPKHGTPTNAQTIASGERELQRCWKHPGLKKVLDKIFSVESDNNFGAQPYYSQDETPDRYGTLVVKQDTWTVIDPGDSGENSPGSEKTGDTFVVIDFSLQPQMLRSWLAAVRGAAYYAIAFILLICTVTRLTRVYYKWIRGCCMWIKDGFSKT